MGIFTRISDIISANFNDMVDSFEDPEKMLRQAVREMETAIEKSRREVAKAMASEKVLRKELDKNRQQVNVWEDRAASAVKDGNDDLAKKAIARRREHESIVAALTEEAEHAGEATQTLRRQLEAMQAKLAEAKRRLATLSARQRAAAVKARIAGSTTPTLDDSAFAKFDRMKAKVEHAEAEAEAMKELADDPYNDLVNDDTDDKGPSDDLDLDAELAELKKKVKKN